MKYNSPFIVDLRSDTVTRPTKGMLDAMLSASVGDDVFYDDPSVIALEEKAAKLFGKEAGVFCPSGTMTNQIAIKVHTQPGDEVICDRMAHIYNFEAGGIAFNSGASVRLIEGDRGRFTAQDVENNINPDNTHYARTTLVAAENTSNRGGGSYYTLSELERIGEVCKKHRLKYHLDGARIFNALVETGESPEQYGHLFDSISVCFSKGLGCPVGSVLLGTKDFINRARRIRKVFGGGMRQAGYLAAAAIYAMDNHISRLKDDHAKARLLGDVLDKCTFVENRMPVDTNIVIFTLKKPLVANDFVQKMLIENIKVVAISPHDVRMVTHLDFTDEMLEYTVGILKKNNITSIQSILYERS